MRRAFQALLAVGGCLFVLAGCSNATAPQPLTPISQQASWVDCEARFGYFVRSGKSEHYSDSACEVEIPQ